MVDIEESVACLTCFVQRGSVKKPVTGLREAGGEPGVGGWRLFSEIWVSDFGGGGVLQGGREFML